MTAEFIPPKFDYLDLESARRVRDGAIDAMAALDSALGDIYGAVPESHRPALKQAFGRAMGELVCEILRPSVRAYPELDPSTETWVAVVEERARARAARFDEVQDRPESHPR
jgi:hypothetical protein